MQRNSELVDLREIDCLVFRVYHCSKISQLVLVINIGIYLSTRSSRIFHDTRNSGFDFVLTLSFHKRLRVDSFEQLFRCCLDDRIPRVLSVLFQSCCTTLSSQTSSVHDRHGSSFRFIFRCAHFGVFRT